MKKPEVLAPAGSMTALQAAFDNGADAVYLGLGSHNMRSRSADNFTLEDLKEASRRARAAGRKIYLTLNTILFEDEIGEVDKLVRQSMPYADAFIVSDWAVVSLCRKYGAQFHVSTQMSLSNSLAVNFLRSQGASRVVLARECTLDEIGRIAKSTGVEIEVFAHGAQCIAVSGRCLLSHSVYGCSANRGECKQPCRRSFQIRPVNRNTLSAEEGGESFTVTPHTVLSARDVCSLPYLERLVSAGVSSLKIEGRARNANYVGTVAGAYRRAVDAIALGEYTPRLREELLERVGSVFHREFGSGLHFGRIEGSETSEGENSRASTVKRFVGPVLNYYAKAGVLMVEVKDAGISSGDRLQVHGPTTGVAEFTATDLRRDEESLSSAERGNWVTMPSPRCRRGDKLFLVSERKTQ